MNTTTTLDRARRGVFPKEFRPGETFERVVESADRVVFIRLKPAEVQAGHVRKVSGKTMLSECLDSDVIQRAIRADRDL